MKTPPFKSTRDENTFLESHKEWTRPLNHIKDDRLLLATTTTLNHSRSHLMKVIALPTLDFSMPCHREFLSTQTSLTSVFWNEILPLYL